MEDLTRVFIIFIKILSSIKSNLREVEKEGISI